MLKPEMQRPRIVLHEISEIPDHCLIIESGLFGSRCLKSVTTNLSLNIY